MKLTNSQEEYLKTIYILESNKNKVRVTDIANKMSITKPSVNKAVKTLNELELLNYETYGEITLTNNGKKLAKEIIKREDIIEMFLEEILEIDKKQAKKEAISMKHAISSDTSKKLEKYISEIFNLEGLECNYDEKSEKCQKCIKITAKNRMKKKENKKC